MRFEEKDEGAADDVIYQSLRQRPIEFPTHPAVNTGKDAGDQVPDVHRLKLKKGYSISPNRMKKSQKPKICAIEQSLRSRLASGSG